MLIKLLMASSLVGQGLSFYKVYSVHLLLALVFWKEFSLTKLKDFAVKEKPLVFMVAYATLSLLWTNSLFLGVRDILYLVMGVSIVYCVSSSKIHSRDLLKVVGVVTFANLFISVGESLDLFRFPISQYSPLAPFFGKKFIGVEVGKTIPSGFHSNPNNNALSFLMFAPLVLSYLNGWKAYLFLGITTFIIFMASSKLMLVGWVVLLAVILGFVIRRKFGTAKAILTFVVLASLLSGLMYFTGGNRIYKYSLTIPSLKTFMIEAPQNLANRFMGKEVKFDYVKLDTSLHWRLTYLDGVASVLSKKLWFGAGAGSLDGIYNEQGGVRVSLKNPHFYFLEIAAKFGIFFLGIYLFWLWRIFRNVTRVNRLYGISILMFVFFNPVIASAIYFVPKWGLYALMLKISNESVSVLVDKSLSEGHENDPNVQPQ